MEGDGSPRRQMISGGNNSGDTTESTTEGLCDEIEHGVSQGGAPGCDRRPQGILPRLTQHESGRIPERIWAAGAGEEGPSRASSWIGCFLEGKMECGREVRELRSAREGLYI